MLRNATIRAVLFMATTCTAVWGQAPPLIQTGTKPAFVLPTLYGPNGLFLAPSRDNSGNLTVPPHTGHFNSGFQQSFSPLNTAIATQLSLLPIPSPASGFVYHEDPATGLVSRSTQSFGPILAERAETLGKKKFYFGVAYQHFNFTTLDGQKLSALPALFTHDVDPNNVRSKDVITSINNLDLNVDQTSLLMTAGLTNRLDVAVAIPIVHTSMSASSGATIQRIATADQIYLHTFVESSNVTQKTFTNSGSATGLGDIIFRVKGTVLNGKRVAAALAADFRAPSGDAKNFLGSGAPGVKPFFILSFPGVVSPHVNVGYQWNGNSILAGNNVLQNTKGHLPNDFFYTFGTDIGVVPKRLSLAFDVLGIRLMNADRVQSGFYDTQSQQVAGSAGSSTFPTMLIQSGKGISINNASIGFKLNPVGELLFTANVLLKLDDGGLRQKATPLVGLSYTFK